MRRHSVRRKQGKILKKKWVVITIVVLIWLVSYVYISNNNPQVIQEEIDINKFIKS